MTAGNALYVHDVGRGFYFKQLVHVILYYPLHLLILILQHK